MQAARRIQTFTEHTVTSLQGLADRLGFWPRLVFDRGFGNKAIVTHLAAAGATFYIRLKAGRYVECDQETTEVKDLTDRDTTVRLYGLTLRVVRSPKSRRAREPWYILTNDVKSSRTKIIRIYYHRFEIEESFRDIKSILGLRRTKLMRPLSLAVLFWMVSLGILLLYLAGLKTYGKKLLHQMASVGLAKKRLSWFRYLYEMVEQALRQPFYEIIAGGV